MRLCIVTSLGLLLTACGLSMNPDLPSTKEGGGSGFDPPPTAGGNGDNGGPIAIGDGDEMNTPPGLPAGAGGSSERCLGPGGAGGASTCGEGAR